MSYGFYRTVTIDPTKVPGNLTDHPVLFNTTHNDLRSTGNGGHVFSVLGYDIVFSPNVDGSAEYAHEIEEYDPVTGEFVAHVKIPAVDATVDTVFYIVYGDPSIVASQEDIPGVWDADFKAVWHLEEGAGAAVDSTSNNNDGAFQDSLPDPQVGQIAEAQDLDGTDDYVAVPTSADFDLRDVSEKPFTISAWVDLDTTTVNGRTILSIGTTDYNAFGILLNTDRKIYLVASLNGSSWGILSLSTNAVTLNTLSWVVVTRNTSGAYYCYIDNVYAGNAFTEATDIYLNTYSLKIGGHYSLVGDSWDGLLDEVRVSSIVRSSDYRTATYNNQSAPGTFYTLGAEQSKPVTDTGAGVDTIAVARHSFITDSGVGVETLDVSYVFIDDSGVGVETLAILASMSLTDTGEGTEAVSAMRTSCPDGGGPAVSGASPRNHPHTGKYYLAAQPWKVLFSGRITGWSDQMNITYDQGNFPGTPMIGMTLIMVQDDGTWAKVRTKSVPSLLAGSIVVAENDHMNWDYNKTVYILNRFELWPVHPRVTYNGGITVYKDYDIVYTDQNEKLYPVPIMGPPAVAFLSSGSASVHFSGGLSYTPDPEDWPDIISWSWSFEGGTPVVSNEMGLEVTWASPGVYLVSLTVTNSNGKQSTGYRYVYIYDRTGDDAPYSKFSIQSLTGSAAEGGWSCSVAVWEENVSQEDFPEGTQIILFAEEKWNADDVYSAGFFSGRDNIKMVGWIEGGSVEFNSETGTVSFRVVGIHALMKNCEVFSCALDYNATPTVWTQLQGMNGIRAFHHLIYWQTTLMKIVDVWLPDRLPGASPWQRFPAAWYIQFQDFGRATLWAQLASLAKDVFCSLASDRFSNFYLGRNPQSTEEAYLTSITTWISLYKTDWHGDADIVTRDEPACSQYTLEGVHYDGATATARFSYAPGTVPAQRGKAKTYTGAVLGTQALSNALVGRLYAVENNAIPRATLKLLGNYGPCVDVAPFQWALITLASGDTPRSFVWDEKRFLVKRVIDYIAVTQGTSHTDIELEAYAFGGPGIGFEGKEVEVNDVGVGLDEITLGTETAFAACYSLQAASLCPIGHYPKDYGDWEEGIPPDGPTFVYIAAANDITVTFKDSPLLEDTPIDWAYWIIQTKNNVVKEEEIGDVLMYWDDAGHSIEIARNFHTGWAYGVGNVCDPGVGFYDPDYCPPIEAGWKPAYRWFGGDLSTVLEELIADVGWAGQIDLKMEGDGGDRRHVTGVDVAGPWPTTVVVFVYKPDVDLPNDEETWLPAQNDLTDAGTIITGACGVSVNPTALTHVVCGSRVLGIRYTNVQIAQGSSIGLSRISLELETNQGAGAYVLGFRIYVHASDDSPAFSAADNPYARVVDGSVAVDDDDVRLYVQWDLPTVSGSAWFVSPDISSLLQSIASRAGWVSGNAICFSLIPIYPHTTLQPTIGYPQDAWHEANQVKVTDGDLEWSYGASIYIEDSGVGTEGILRT